MTVDSIDPTWAIVSFPPNTPIVRLRNLGLPSPMSGWPPSPAAAAPPPEPEVEQETSFGSIHYLLNLSGAGAACCVLLFLLVKMRSDHRRYPGPSSLASKLLAVARATPAQIALHCGADAAQFLLFERYVFLSLIPISLISLLIALPLNILTNSAPVPDHFSTTIIAHVPKHSPLLWIHLLLCTAIAFIAHIGVSKMEAALRVTRFRDGGGSTVDPNSASLAVFTVMIQNVPKSLAADPSPFLDYFQRRYPGKVYKVVAPFDLCTLDSLVDEWCKVSNKISWLEARRIAHDLFDEQAMENARRANDPWLVKKGRKMWRQAAEMLGYTLEGSLKKLHARKMAISNMLLEYKECRAAGAGTAFVIFKDVHSANKAVRDFRSEKKKMAVGHAELQLEITRWKVERAPPASDIYWNHIGLSKMQLNMRRIMVNSCLVLTLLFFSSPLAIISAMQGAARIIDAEAMDHALSWLAWLQNSSWFWSIVFEFLPNVLIFISMYVIIPSVLSYFSKFECHLTVSGEQRAALLKLVCFFLVNLILLRSLVESSLESWIVGMGRCYLDSVDCQQIEKYLSPSFLTRSSLLSLAFLITSTFLGISFDLLTPMPWIKKLLKRFRKNDMVQLVPEEGEAATLAQSNQENNLTTPLVPERQNSEGFLTIEGLDMSMYPLVNRSFHMPKQTFDFAQYYAFDLTIFALTMIYSLISPLIVPVGTIYFGYRYIVDKYNFLFVYRARGFPAGNDGRLMDRVICIVQFCVVFFLSAMLLYFAVHGDSLKLQAICTLGLLIFYKLLPTSSDAMQPSLLDGLQASPSFVDGPTDYEVFSKPSLDWDLYLR